jgi:serine/threonine-protein kinase RsbW
VEPLTSLDAADAVTIAVPARAGFVHVLRSVTGSVAGHMLLTLDDVDDLRLAVDEACERLLSLPGTPRTIRLELHAFPTRVEAIVAVDATAIWPPGGFEDTLSWRILGALSDHARFEIWNGCPAIRIVKRTLRGAG